ncbi:hypothetical protein M8C85_002883 [Salmonella enterica]|uniref:hypothetical protein n=1 Tax=Salmonella bongori TaxID=54736 RepID=UPI000A28AF4F|nr:hypothetical protein [Salmonella bongori]EBV6969540.1 hypothetical protein [Salmonella enterica subsp. enterica serovar Gaminara]ECB6674266.1 hypothetical protein [Salmonella enterica subsp. enterica serovar Kottbus]ECC3819025.1 hypothetical protein [Salmonella enterica subsp. enterica]ECJ2324000.1 hypothetical protein [Salmonella enterica subsp. salamae serovar Sofia]ECO0312780.1 hypothetical protein [Salmonella enterica subsp. enterica serovar Schwarzengrund]ECZ0089413.1 hypothetical pro
MGQLQLVLLDRFARQVTGQSLSDLQPLEGTGSQAHEIIWPLGSFFKNRTEDILKTDYCHDYEPQADQAIEDYVFRDIPWNDAPLPVITVLYERFVQLCSLFVAHKLNNSITMLPPCIGEKERTKFLALFWLHGMTLPFPVKGQSLFEHGKLFPPQGGVH